MRLTPTETAAIIERVQERRQAEAGLHLRVRMHLEKFDHLVEPPRLFEYQIREHGQCVYLEQWDEGRGRMRRMIPPEED